MDRLDEQVARIIREQHDQTLGNQAPMDSLPLSEAEAGGYPPPEAYDYDPTTNNPPASALPATRAPITPPVTDAANVRMPVSQANIEATATDVLALDLQSSLHTALAHSPDYQTRREDLYLSALTLLAEKHLWGPRFFSSVAGIVSGTPEDGEHDQALSVITEFGVTQRLPYGGSVSASALVNFVSLLKDVSGTEDNQDSAFVLSARLPLLRGAGMSAREDLIQSYRNLLYATRSFERFRREFLLTVSSRYFDLLQSQAQIANLQRQVNNLEWLSSRIQAMANAGRQPFFEVQRAQQQVLFAQNNLLNAQESYATGLDAFKILIGLDTNQPIRIIPSEVMIPEPTLDVVESVATAKLLRLDLQTAGDQVHDLQRRVAFARNRLLPELDFVADLQLNTDPAERYGRLDIDLGSSNYSAGIVLDLPLDRKLEEINVRRTLINLERGKRSHALLADRVAQQVRQSIRQISQARFTLDIQNLNINMAQKRLDGVVLRLAKLAPRDFTDAESDLLEARNRRDRAVRDLRVSILQYLLDTGQLRVTAQGQWKPPALMVAAIDPAAGVESDNPGNVFDPSAAPGQTTDPAAPTMNQSEQPAAGQPTPDVTPPVQIPDESPDASAAPSSTSPAVNLPTSETPTSETLP